MSELRDWRTRLDLGAENAGAENIGAENAGAENADAENAGEEEAGGKDSGADSGGAVGAAAMGAANQPDDVAGGSTEADEQLVEPDEPASAAQRDQARASVWSGRAVGPLSRLLPGGSVDPLVGPADNQADGTSDTAEPEEPAESAGAADAVGSAESRRAAEQALAVESGGPVEPNGAAEADGADESPESSGGVESPAALESMESARTADVADAGEPHAALVPAGADLTSAEDRWRSVLVGFVDDPPGSVEAASALIEEDVARHIALLARHKEAMHSAWRDNLDVDTEALRVALVNYRDLRNRLADVLMVLTR